MKVFVFCDVCEEEIGFQGEVFKISDLRCDHWMHRSCMGRGAAEGEGKCPMAQCGLEGGLVSGKAIGIVWVETGVGEGGVGNEGEGGVGNEGEGGVGKEAEEVGNEGEGGVGNEMEGEVGNEQGGVGKEEEGGVGKEEEGGVGKEGEGGVGKEGEGGVGKEEEEGVGKEGEGGVGEEEEGGVGNEAKEMEGEGGGVGKEEEKEGEGGGVGKEEEGVVVEMPPLQGAGLHCPYCHMRFSKGCGWQKTRHIQKEHDCIHCPKKFKSAKHVSRHMKVAHGGLCASRFLCATCKVAFGRNETLTRHIHKHPGHKRAPP